MSMLWRCYYGLVICYKNCLIGTRFSASPNIAVVTAEIARETATTFVVPDCLSQYIVIAVEPLGYI